MRGFLLMLAFTAMATTYVVGTRGYDEAAWGFLVLAVVLVACVISIDRRK